MLAITYEEIRNSVLLYSPKLVSGILVMIGFYLAALIAQSIICRIAKARRIEENLTWFMGASAKVALIVFGVVSGLGTMGIDVGAMVAGLGLTGFALGFALKDIISNLLSGVLIMIFKPFRTGDRIRVMSFEGQVMRIDMRYTRLKSNDNNTVFVPNSLLFTNAITVDNPNAAEKAPGGTQL